MQLFAALATGLTTVAGLGMITTGAAIEPALASAAEVQAIAGVPVVGVLPGSGAGRAPTSDPRRQRLLRVGLVAAGIALLAACLLVMVAMHA